VRPEPHICASQLDGSNSATSLTAGRLLARNTLLSISGELAPLVLGLMAVPILVRELGPDRYGILTLSNVVVGYLGLFDLGLGRAAVQQMSDAIGAGETERIPEIFWTSVIAMAALGIAAAGIIIGLSHWLVTGLLPIPVGLQAETVGVFVILGAVMPFILSGSCLSGTLRSFQRFDLTAKIGAATGIYSLLAPLAMLVFTHKLVWIVFVLAAGRLCAWAVSLKLCLGLVPDLTGRIQAWSAAFLPLVRFGGWITISGLASPLMVSLDRLIIGSMISITAVTYYAVPYQIVAKIPLLPSVMAGVLFPAFSATARRDPECAADLLERTSRYALLVLFPAVLVLYCFAPEVLYCFFGAKLSEQSSPAMRWLLIGVLMNGLAFIPYGLVQAANRPDLTAKFHLAELPIYFVALFLLLPRFGIAGAAAAWAIRVTIDSLALFSSSAILLPSAKTRIIHIFSLSLLASVLITCAGRPDKLEARLVCVCIILIGYSVVGWRHVLDSKDRGAAKKEFKAFKFRLMPFRQPG
jgi:O-antigen/teichoic acid export membrane protein